MGLLKKAAELCILCDISMTILFKDLCGKVVCYASSSMEERLEEMQNIDIQFSEKNYPDFSTRSFQRNKRFELQKEMMNKFLPKIDQGESLKKLKKELDKFIPNYSFERLVSIPEPEFDKSETDSDSISSINEEMEICRNQSFNTELESKLKRRKPDNFNNVILSNTFHIEDLINSSSNRGIYSEIDVSRKNNYEVLDEEVRFDNPKEMDFIDFNTNLKSSMFDVMNYI